MKDFSDTVQKVQEATRYICLKTSANPGIGIILGSGLGSFINEINIGTKLSFSEIPHFQATTIEGHQGNMIFGQVGPHQIVALQGRVHFYEGHSMETVIFPVRVMAALGIEILILTNSAGGCGDGMMAGDFMIIDDHINFFGTNPLIGPNANELGPRFPDMSEAYDANLSNHMAIIMEKSGVRFHRGVYGGLTGPTYETPAEVRFLKKAGCSAVGMSTVPECIAANHLGLRVVAVSCISNLAAGVAKHKLTHDEVTQTGRRVEKQFSSVIKEFVSSFRGEKGLFA